MDDISRLAVTIACQQAIHRFYSALDRGDMPAVAHAVSADGVWHRQGEALHGPQAVLAALDRRPAGRRTAHLVQNLVVDVDDETHARATYMTLVYRHDAEQVQVGPRPLTLPFAISTNVDVLIREADGEWRMMDKRGSQVFAV